ncbi:hypothetical protein BJF81_13740 [Ornithinimicrobium sp. CNJ-824]|nr:hypothetical protein BJF81_13740 [Ornithinimicrobium sp. CNJ-824]
MQPAHVPLHRSPPLDHRTVGLPPLAERPTQAAQLASAVGMTWVRRIRWSWRRCSSARSNR